MARLTSWDDARFAKLIADQIVIPATEDVLAEAQRTCPRRDGDLARSLTYEIDVSGAEVVGTVYTDMPYAPYVHEGRGPVEAPPGGVLGPLPSPYPRFVKRVAAAEGQPWLREALRSAQPWPVQGR